MGFSRGIVLAAAVLAVTGAAAAEETTVYECDVDHSARLTGGHPEVAGPKIGTAQDPDRVFAIEISSPEAVTSCGESCRMKQSVREVPTRRPRPDGPDLCESGGNRVLMGTYSATGTPDEFSTDFHADKDLGVLRLIGPFEDGKTYLFWQSGFEYPGCEDTHLAVRRGECKKRK